MVNTDHPPPREGAGRCCMREAGRGHAGEEGPGKAPKAKQQRGHDPELLAPELTIKPPVLNNSVISF